MSFLGAMDFLVRSEALEHVASALENDADAEVRSRNQERRASVGSLPPPVRAAVAGDAAASGDVGATPLKFTILEAEMENLSEQLLREQRKSARYEKQIESIIIQHNEEIIKLNSQAEELKLQLAQTHRRLARFQEKLSASEEGQLIKAMHAKEQMIEALQVPRLVARGFAHLTSTPPPPPPPSVPLSPPMTNQEKIDMLRSDMSQKGEPRLAYHPSPAVAPHSHIIHHITCSRPSLFATF